MEDEYVYATDEEALLAHAVHKDIEAEAHPAVCGYEPPFGAWFVGGTAQYGKCSACERLRRSEARRKTVFDMVKKRMDRNAQVRG